MFFLILNGEYLSFLIGSIIMYIPPSLLPFRIRILIPDPVYFFYRIRNTVLDPSTQLNYVHILIKLTFVWYSWNISFTSVTRQTVFCNFLRFQAPRHKQFSHLRTQTMMRVPSSEIIKSKQYSRWFIHAHSVWCLELILSPNVPIAFTVLSKRYWCIRP